MHHLIKYTFLSSTLSQSLPWLPYSVRKDHSGIINFLQDFIQKLEDEGEWSNISQQIKSGSMDLTTRDSDRGSGGRLSIYYLKLTGSYGSWINNNLFNLYKSSSFSFQLPKVRLNIFFIILFRRTFHCREDGVGNDSQNSITVSSFFQWLTGQTHVSLIASQWEAFKNSIEFDHDCDVHYGQHSKCYPVVNVKSSRSNFKCNK